MEGTDWHVSQTDVAIAGLGWLGVAVGGRAELEVWAHDGVGITTHQSLVPDLAKDWERPGFDRSTKMMAFGKRKAKEDDEKKRQSRQRAERLKERLQGGTLPPTSPEQPAAEQE